MIERRPSSEVNSDPRLVAPKTIDLRQSPLSEKALKTALARPCQPFTVGGFRPSLDPRASVFGGVRVFASNDRWPTRDGKPLLGIFQINLQDAKFVPDALRDLAMIQLFIADDSYPTGQTLCTIAPSLDAVAVVRTYRTLEKLVPIDAPASALKAFEIAWDIPKTDYANHDVAPVDTSINDVYGYEWAQRVEGAEPH